MVRVPVLVIMMVVAMLVIMIVAGIVPVAVEEVGLDVEDAVEIEGVAAQNLVERNFCPFGLVHLGIAVDGADAFNKLGARLFDAVISDVEMPNIDGLTLAARIRQDAKYKELPIILLTSLASDEDRQRGSEVGANAYITKGTFEQTALLDTLRRLV